MPEIRKDPVTDRWVIIATERAKRPAELKAQPDVRKGGPCVFCPGEESKTPPEEYALRAPGTHKDAPGWTVRAFKNKFPALQADLETELVQQGIYTTMTGKGAHEVVVETPDHDKNLEDLSVSEIADVLRVLHQRYTQLAKDPEHRYVLVFKNAGQAAGASLEHSHCQIIATPLVPVKIKEEIEGAREHHKRTGSCVYCEMLAREAKEGTRQVAETEHFYAFNPYASCFPFETWIIPKKHEPDFGSVSSEQLEDLARVLKQTLGALADILDTPPYNIVLHTAPCNDEPCPEYHWHLEIVPRLTKIAGFEWGTGYYINPMPPENAADALRLRAEMPKEQIH